MTATLRDEAQTIAARRPDAIQSMTVTQRRAFLHEIAEHVENEQRWGHRPLTDAVPVIVPAVASAFCPDPVAAFHELVGAVAERQAFVADEPGYCDRQETTVAEADRRTSSDVEYWLDSLVGAS